MAETSTAAAVTWVQRLLAAVGLLALVVVIVLAARGCGGESEDAFSFHTESAPAEYLYLDLSRVRAYLSQIQGGLADATRQTRSVGTSRNLGLSVSGVTGGVGDQQQSSSERVVTATAASLFLGLRDQLRKRRQMIVIDARRPRTTTFTRVSKLREGQFVELRNVRLEVPDYLLPYLILNYPADRPEALVQLSTGQRRQVRKYLKAVGDNPRLMLRWAVCRGPRKAFDCFKLLLPIRYGSLTDEWSLYTRGRMTVVAKVTRKVNRIGDFYFDEVVQSEFQRSAAFLPTRPLNDFLDLDRVKLGVSLGQATSLSGGDVNGVVVLPVAVFT